MVSERNEQGIRKKKKKDKAFLYIVLLGLAAEFISSSRISKGRAVFPSPGKMITPLSSKAGHIKLPSNHLIKAPCWHQPSSGPIFHLGTFHYTFQSKFAFSKAKNANDWL